MSTNERPYHVLIYGATGYTGILISEYFAKHVALSDPNIRWGIVGRDIDKMLGLIKYLVIKTNNKKLEQLKYFIVSQQDELEDIFRKTQVVINCVGPFFKYGEPVVEACIKAKTHYTDITGEPNYIRNILKYNEEARNNNLIIVPAAGFDSVPADMCVFLAQNRSKSPLSEVRLYVEPLTGGLSYGTINTFIESISKGPKRAPKEGEQKTKSIQKLVPHRASRTKDWVVPFNYTSDPYVVTLSARQANIKPFCYAQYLQVKGFFQMIWFMFIGFLLFLIVKIPGGGKFILGLQKKGSGPSEQVRMLCRTGVQLFASNEEKDLIEVAFHGPESYTVTAIFASEVALTLVTDSHNCKPGVVTTAYGLGENLMKRLRKNEKLRFAVVDVKHNAPPME